MALGMLQIVQETGKRFGENLEVRIGIHSGEVSQASSVGTGSIYDVWGDTAIRRARLPSRPGCLNRVQFQKRLTTI